MDDEQQYDQVAEQTVVGAMLLDREAIWTALETLAPTDFYQPKHEVIARAAIALAERDEPSDVIAVSNELEKTGNMTRAGGIGYLFELTTLVGSVVSVGYYADIVRQKAIRRRLHGAGQRIMSMGAATEGDPLKLVDEAQQELEQVARHTRVDVHAVGDTLDAAIARLEEKPEFAPTGFESLDKVIGGLAAGNLIIVGARPGEGKTILGMNLATALARRGMVVYVSLEMSEDELQLRLISQFGEVHMKSLRNHTLNDEQRKRVAIARQKMQGAPIFIDDQSTTLAEMRAYIRSVSRRGQLAGVVVDYLQLMEGGDPKQSRQEFVGSVSRQLKLLAKQLRVPVIALSQLNRLVEGRKSRVPILSDLRESGSIEQDADSVLLLSYDRKTPADLTVAVGKNRHGELGEVSLIWQGQFARLRDRTWSPYGAVALDGTEAA
ncbi:replicative DNA helicase [Curtobacterium sp. Csp1]|uniref:replicative DNA helicase n=1 Tax=unclassified Curtobacterium TaxID=257496 RepID=UPI0015977E3D|nr:MULTISPECIES: replicative DNA helicase [unclassified Curtobacterium]QKS13930.1 replicative DNA helicase [Curtobacterium sp. csp3]QKS20973.1 replicative DNA helicase [Curtobacterium sp. Csp1]